MERMKISKYTVAVILLTIGIFFIPFFWLKPGEMDLGGDNSRLYFYDPIAYLVSQSLYSVSHSAYGAENLSYYPIPFFLLLAWVKSLVHSPTILISIFHGLNLSIGFLSCYLVIKELLTREETASTQNHFVIQASSVMAGLYYSFSPNPIRWWGFQLLPMNLVFLNPLLFFLLLRFFLTRSMRYIYISLLITFLFSPNFSFIGAPTFFSFFPLAVLFLIIYTKVIKKKPTPVAKIAIALLLFVLLQSFHLLPQIVSILTPGSFAHEFVFGAEGKLQWGLKYFAATAPSIKVSYALFGLMQYVEPEPYWKLFVVFPVMFVSAFLWNKSKVFLLSAVFFLITLFFVSANITQTGLKLYMAAFQLPGFSMFRVFFGQWQGAYLFFYTLFVGLSFSTILRKLTVVRRVLLLALCVLLFVTTAWPFITGKLTDTKLWQSKDIRSHVEMDPAYEEALGYIRSLPVDGKILSLPLNDHGYQVLKGKNDAAYVGPSTITYLAARNEFTSNAELGVFGPSLLMAVRTGNYPMVRSILSVLNVKYIFYNDDPYVYLNNFPAFPYIEARNFFPDSQEGYREFIKNLGVKEIQTIAGKYHMYAFEDASYTPHVYVADRVSYWNDAIAANVHTPLSFYPEDKSVALHEDMKVFANYRAMFDDVLLKARNTNAIFDFFKKKKEDKFVSPTISRKLSSFIYPLVVVKEKRDLARFATINDAYIYRSIYFAEKRINELVRLEHIPLLKNISSISELSKTWKEPSVWDWRRFNEYNSWEITLVRYQKAIEKLIDDLERTNQSGYSVITSKVELKSYLKDHKKLLRNSMREETLWSIDDRKYISSLIERMFTDILERLNLRLPDINTIPYSLEYPMEDGSYEVYIHKKDIENLGIILRIDGKEVELKKSDQSEWMRFNDILVQDTQSLPIQVHIPSVPNSVGATRWKKPELIPSSIEEGPNDSITLAIAYNFLADTSGLVRNITDWKEESIYAISFDYLTHDKDFSLILHERGGTRTSQYFNPVYEDTFRSNEWKRYANVVLSSKDAKSAFLQFVRAKDDFEDLNDTNLKEITIKNLAVQKIYNPRIVFKKVVTPDGAPKPFITFTMINPTKYRVDVRGARDPYTLVLSQAFSQKWKLFFPSMNNKAQTYKGIFARFMGNILHLLTKPFINSSSVDDLRVSATYANGSIQEGVYKSTLLDANTFETWGQDPIAESTHLPVNGCANSWHIRPGDVGNQKDYTLIIEMTPQKLFYGSVFLSLGTLGIVIIMLFASLIKVRKSDI